MPSCQAVMSSSGNNCDLTAIWTAYYSRNLGIFLFPYDKRTSINPRLAAEKRGEYRVDRFLVDINGVRHEYSNHQDDLEEYHFCYYHLKLLRGHIVPGVGVDYPHGAAVVPGNKTIKTDTTAKIIPPSRTAAQKSYRCCGMQKVTAGSAPTSKPKNTNNLAFLLYGTPDIV